MCLSNLSKQVYIYSLSTDAFFTEEERAIKLMKDRYYDLKRLGKREDDIKEQLHKLKTELNELNKKRPKTKKEKKKIEFKQGQIGTTQRQLDYLNWLRKLFADKKVSNAAYKRELNSKISDFDGVRKLNTLCLNPSKTIALFESSLTRQLKLETNKLSEKLIVIEIFNYEVFKQLLHNGFTFRNKQYVFWSSSSGQIRDKKAIFIEKEAWGNIEDSITAGLSIKDINNNGGMSVNKFLAYKALASSSSEKWEGFDITKCIVVDDVKVLLQGRTVDYIHRDTFEVERTNKKKIELEITDGAGMCLPIVSERLFGEGVYKNWQFRLPWMKGAMSPVPFTDWGDDLKVTDIYGKKWDIKEDEIEVIFFKSQFKMHKHFINKEDYKESWKVYQDNFKKYKCEAGYMNVEEDIIPNAKTNYQYLQSLVNIKPKNLMAIDLMAIAGMTNDIISNLGSDADTMIEVLGADDANKEKNEFQKAINLYPALLNDNNTKEAIKKRKERIVKEGKAGKLTIDGKYTYILPDWVAVMENIFDGVENPKGLLADNQVSCSLYDEGKVNLMRSPALSFEHVIKENVRSREMEKWFKTKAVHISSETLLSKVLQADYDGDKILVTPSEVLIRCVEENAKLLDVVPLEYEMGVSEPKNIDPTSIYESLTVAFKANIGVISNTISKIFNKSDFSADDYKLIKQMCSYNNHVIDMAKTLDVVKLPDGLKKEWNDYNKQKLPYFFRYAKKKDSTLDKNTSTVNLLENIIINKRIYFRKVVGDFDWKKLLWTPYFKDNAFVIDEKTDKKIIREYTYLDRNKRNYIDDENEIDDKKQYIYIEIREKLLKIYDDPNKVADVLVRYLFGEKDSEYKTTLWESFGQEVIQAIKKNVLNEVDCFGCGTKIEKPRQRQIRCDNCQKEYRKRQDKLRKRKERQSLENLSA